MNVFVMNAVGSSLKFQVIARERIMHPFVDSLSASKPSRQPEPTAIGTAPCRTSAEDIGIC